MSILADIERRDADAFVTLCSHCIGDRAIYGEESPTILMLIEQGEEFVMNPEGIVRLNSLGRIDFKIGAEF